MLEQKLEETILELRELTAVLRAIQAFIPTAVGYAQQKAKSTEPPSPTPDAANDSSISDSEQETVALQEMRDELNRTLLAIARKDRAQAIELINRFGAKKATDIADEQVTTALGDAEALLAALSEDAA